MYRVKAELKPDNILHEQILSISFTLDSTGVIFCVTEEGATRLGYTRDELTGRHILSLFYSEDQQRLETSLRKFCQINQSSCTPIKVAEGEFRLVCQDGNLLWVKAIAQTIPRNKTRREIEPHEAPNILLVCEGMSESEHAEQILQDSELHRVILSSISDAVLITDEIGRFTFICPNVDRIFGYSQAEVLQLGNISQLLGNRCNLKQLETAGEISNFEQEIVDKSGQTHSLLVNIKRVSLQGGTVLYSCRDITDWKHSQKVGKASGCQFPAILERVSEEETVHPPTEELRQDRNHLEEQVEERTAELTWVNEQLQREIWERQQVETVLRQTQERYRTIVEDQTDLICRFSKEGTLTFVNEAYCCYFGLSRQELVGQSLWQLIPPEDHKTIQQHLATLNPDNPTATFEYQFVMPDGEVYTHQWTNRAIYNPQAQLIEFQSVGRDITQRKRAEERVAKLNECFLSFGPHPIDNINRLTAVAGELLGAVCALYNRIDKGMLCTIGQWWTPENYNPMDQPEGHICWDVIQGGGNQLFVVRDLLNTPYAQTDPNVRSHQLQTYLGQAVKCHDAYIGSLCLVYQKDFIPSEADRKLMGIISAAIGIEEERQQAETALRVSEERFRSLSACSPVGIFVADCEGRCTYTNPRFQAICGLTFEESLGEGWLKAIHPEDRERVVLEWSSCAREGQGCFKQYRFHTPAGILRWVECRTSPILSDRGEVMGYVGTIEDITERQRAEEELSLRHRELVTLHRISEIALSAESLQATFQQIVEEISTATGFPIMAIELYDEAQQMMVFVGMKGVPLPANQTVLEVPLEETLSATVVRTGQPVVKVYAPQEAKKCDSNETLSHLGIKTFICMPMLVNQQVIGVLSLAHPEIISFSDHFLRWVASLANYVASLIERKQSEEVLRQQAERDRLLGAITQRIRQSLDLEEILNTAVTEVRQFLQTDRTIIYRFEPDWSGVVAVESVESGWPVLLGRVIKDPCFVATYVPQYQQGRIRTIENIHTAGLGQCHFDLLAEFQVKANLVVPILQGEHLWGLLIAHHCSVARRWQNSEIELLKQLATQVGIAIQQSQLYQQLKEANRELQQLATLDGLTQVANRRRFDEYLEQEWRRAIREQASLSLILCDIDFFKRYNDTYGHQAGDDCLRAVANAIRQAVKRSGDLVARYGGEEFAVILPHTEALGALRVAEEIQAYVKALQIPHVNSLVTPYITLSLGVATLVPGNESSPAVLISSADQALYQAKAQGRDRYFVKGA